MQKLNYFNYCAVAVLFVVAATVLLRGLVNNRRDRLFWYVILVAFGSTAFDIYAVTLDNSLEMNLVARYVTHLGYLILHNVAMPLYVIYLIELTDTGHRMRKSMVQKVTFSVPFLCVLTALILTPFNGMLFYFDESCAYTHGSWFPMLYVTAAFYLGYGVFYLVRYRKLFSKIQMTALVTMFALMPLSVLVQYRKPVAPIEMFAQTLGILLLLMVIQRPEERLDIVTGFNKNVAYLSDMAKAFYNEKPMHIVLVQITNYKSLYDMLGMEDINTMLKAVADRIRETCASWVRGEEGYYVGRGQFSLVLKPKSIEQAEKLAEALCIALERSFQVNHMDINVQSQSCIIRCPEDISDSQTLLSFGREYEWRESDGHVLWASDIVSRERYDLLHHIDAIIERAFVNRSFSVYYQPIYSVKERRFNSAEALLRLKDEEYGFISPEVFIPAAERSGAIHRIGTYVLEEVCRFISEDAFKELGVDYIEVNLSVVQCMRRDLAWEIMQILKKYNVSTEQINLEITETAASYAQSIMMDNINALAQAGIALSLDDFGTGYSNMQRVALLPLHIVKLDKTFTNLEKNPRLEIVVRNTIQMIKDMNLQIVVEGIESENLVKQFSELDCEYIQGYYYSKPLPKSEFIEFMQRNAIA